MRTGLFKNKQDKKSIHNRKSYSVSHDVYRRISYDFELVSLYSINLAVSHILSLNNLQYKNRLYYED
jgi:hypothetical protein